MSGSNFYVCTLFSGTLGSLVMPPHLGRRNQWYNVEDMQELGLVVNQTWPPHFE